MTALVPRSSAELSTDRHDPRDILGELMSAQLPSAIQAILDAENEMTLKEDTVQYELVFGYDGIVLATFESSHPIHLPLVGSTITVHQTEVSVTDVALDYAVLDGVQRITAEVEVEPA